MKNLIALVIVLISVSALANPFSNFSGSYKPISKPLISMKGMSYCDWLAFREMTGLSITSLNGVYVAEVTSSVHGAGFHSYLTFREYSMDGLYGVKNIAKVSGDKYSASYQVDSIATSTLDSTQWLISKTGSTYHLRLRSLSSNLGVTTSSCVYDLDLIKY